MVAAKPKRKLCIRCRKNKQFSRKVCQACLRLATDQINSGKATEEQIVAAGHLAPRAPTGRPRKRSKAASRKARK